MADYNSFPFNFVVHLDSFSFAPRHLFYDLGNYMTCLHFNLGGMKNVKGYNIMEGLIPSPNPIPL